MLLVFSVSCRASRKNCRRRTQQVPLKESSSGRIYRRELLQMMVK